MRFRPILIQLSLLLCLSAPQSLAAGSAVIAGTVEAVDGNPLPGVIVKLNRMEEARNDRLVSTDENGRFTFVGVTPGPYRIMAKHPDTGFEGMSLGSVVAGDVVVVSIFSRPTKLSHGGLRFELRRYDHSLSFRWPERYRPYQAGF